MERIITAAPAVLFGVLALVSTASLLGADPAEAADVTIRMTSPEIPCPDIETGTSFCVVPEGTQFDTFWQLDSQQTINGYDLAIRWDPSELTLISATQLYPDTGTPVSFLDEPSDPADSNAVALSLLAADTTTLFTLRFEAHPSPSDPGADLWWFANGNGLSPSSVVLQNPGGAGWNLSTPLETPSLSPGGTLVLGLGLVLAAQSRLRSLRRSREE